MSFCRFSPGESDVYVIGTLYRGDENDLCLECCGCRFNTEMTYDEPADVVERYPDPSHWMRGLAWKVHPDFHSRNGEKFIAHLEEHRAAGHLVPQRAIDRIRHEMEEGKWP